MLPNINDVVQRSVTRQDAESAYRHGSGAVWRFYVPMGGESDMWGLLPPEPPAYWSVERDRVLRYTTIKGGLWADAVGIACTKVASQSFEIEGDDVPQLVKRAQNMMLALDGTSYVKGISRGVRDYLTTDNGEFWEIVRASNAAGSRVLGLMHLDSLRCQRTGDPEIPLIYRDLRGRFHELRDHEIIMLCDMPSASAELFGVGLCAASRAYDAIYKTKNLAVYFNEKITGRKTNALEFIAGVSEKTIATGLESAEAENTQRGMTTYKGVTIIPVHTEGTISGYRVEIAGVPDGWDVKVERDAANLEFANAIGMDLQDLQPLSGQGLGTGAQSHVQMEKAKGKGLSARNKDFSHELNQKVFPDKVTFYMREVDLTDEEKKADISHMRATTRNQQVQTGEITNVEARALAVDQDDLPQEFKPQMLEEIDDTLSDTEKPAEETVDEVEPVDEQIPQEQPTQQTTKEHIDAIYALAIAIDKAKRVTI